MSLHNQFQRARAAARARVAADQMQASDRVRRLLLTNSPRALVVLDCSGNILYATESFESVVGCSLSGVCRQRLDKLIHSADRKLAQRQWWKTRRSVDTVQTFDCQVEIGDTRRYINVTLAQAADEENPGCAVVAQLTNITDRRNAELATQQSAEEWHTRLELAQRAGLPIGLWDWDLTTGTLTWSDETYRQFGYAREALRVTVDEVLRTLHPDDRPKVEHAVQSVAEGGTEIEAQFRVIRRNGNVSWIDARGIRVGRDKSRLIGVSIDITNLKKAEQSLGESEEKYRLLLESSAEAIFGLDMAGDCTFCNPASLRLLCYKSPEDLLGKNMHSLIHHTRADGMACDGSQCSIYAAIGRGTASHIANEVLWRADGTSFSAEYWSHPMHKEGKLVGCVATFLDISGRTRVEKALQESEEKYRQLFESNPQPMWVCHIPSLRFLAVNRAAIRHYGYSREEFLAMTLRDLRPPEDIPAMENSALRSPRVNDRGGTWRHQTKDGRTIYVDITDCRLEFEGQTASVVLAYDVTDQKRAEKALVASEGKYRDMVENANYGIFRSTPDGRLLDVNPALVTMLGYGSKQELMACSLDADIYEDPSCRKAILACYEASEHVHNAEAVWKRKDGNLIMVRLSGRKACQEDRMSSHFEVIVEDITERRMLEKELGQAQKMEAVGRLAGGVAHDFNNILMAVHMNGSLLAQGLVPPERLQEKVREILASAERGAALTRQLLAFGRQQVLEPRLVDLNVLLRGISSLIRGMIPENISLTMSLSEQLGAVRADSQQLELVLINFVSNARDAMPSGGRLIIETSDVDASVGPNVSQRILRPGKYALVVFSDTGIGMDPATQARIFEPFFTTKINGRGTGLGLATSYGTVKQSGGYIFVSSERGQGTTFKIYLPRVDPQRTAVAAAAERVFPRGGGETILLVEDEGQVRKSTAEFLSATGYVVLQARDGSEALKLAMSRSAEIAAVVTDMVMPGISGGEVIEILRQLRPSLKAILMSGYTDTKMDQEDPASRFLQKPCSVEVLASTLHQLIVSS